MRDYQNKAGNSETETPEPNKHKDKHGQYNGNTDRRVEHRRQNNEENADDRRKQAKIIFKLKSTNSNSNSGYCESLMCNNSLHSHPRFNPIKASSVHY